MTQIKNTAMFAFLLVLAISFVSSLGVSYPLPQNMELLPGQSSYFQFQIQTDDFPVNCVPIIEETNGLELAFQQKYTVEANQKHVVKPQVIVPKQTAFGNYEATFCIECTPSEEVEGSRIIPTVCGLPLTVGVVSERTGVNLYEETAAANYMIWVTLLSVSIIVLAMVIFYLVRRRRVM